MIRVLYCIWICGLLFAYSAQAQPLPQDLNQDGIVDSEDALLFFQKWHSGEKYTPTPIPPTPTPTSTGLPPTPTPVSVLEETTITLPGDVPMILVRIPAGSFIMGTTDHSWGFNRERPVHDVVISYDFYLGKYEVTQAQWQAVMGNNPATRYGGQYGIGPNNPVYYISWNDINEASGFIDTLNALGLGTFRLPSESEWEYACRAGTTTRFYFGDSECTKFECAPCELNNYAWWCGNTTTTQPVGQKPPNAFGLYDMHGNVDEWCQDLYHDSYEGAPVDGSAWEDGILTERVMRSGGFEYTPIHFTSSFRNFVRPSYAPNDIGLRLVWLPPE